MRSSSLRSSGSEEAHSSCTESTIVPIYVKIRAADCLRLALSCIPEKFFLESSLLMPLVSAQKWKPSWAVKLRGVT
jgi:hypothetical protein